VRFLALGVQPETPDLTRSSLVGADRTMLEVLEHSPFRVGDGAWTSLAEMARDAGQTVAEVVEANDRLESWGFLMWDRASQSAVPVIPAGS
jgi:hypothetical protein